LFITLISVILYGMTPEEAANQGSSGLPTAS
jgi:hypothetical protein